MSRSNKNNAKSLTKKVFFIKFPHIPCFHTPCYPFPLLPFRSRPFIAPKSDVQSALAHAAVPGTQLTTAQYSCHRMYTQQERTSPQSNLRTARRKSPVGYNRTPQIHPKTVPALRRSTPPSNTPIPRPTPLTTPNGTTIRRRGWPLLTPADRQMVQAKCL